MGLFNVGDILKAGAEIADKFITTDKDRLEFQIKKQQLQLKEEEIEAGILEKIHETNIAEAKSKNWFIAGARPFILWVCGFTLAYHYIISPFLHSFFTAFNINFPLPELNIGLLFNLMMSLLGLSGLRTYEKLKGVQDRH